MKIGERVYWRGFASGSLLGGEVVGETVNRAALVLPDKCEYALRISIDALIELPPFPIEIHDCLCGDCRLVSQLRAERGQ